MESNGFNSMSCRLIELKRHAKELLFTRMGQKVFGHVNKYPPIGVASWIREPMKWNTDAARTAYTYRWIFGCTCVAKRTHPVTPATSSLVRSLDSDLLFPSLCGFCFFGCRFSLIRVSNNFGFSTEKGQGHLKSVNHRKYILLFFRSVVQKLVARDFI